MSGAGYGGVGWHDGNHHGIVAGWIAHRRNCRIIRETTERDLTDRGIPIPRRLMSQAQMFWCGFLAGLGVGLFIGLVFWELT